MKEITKEQFEVMTPSERAKYLRDKADSLLETPNR